MRRMAGKSGKADGPRFQDFAEYDHIDKILPELAHQRVTGKFLDLVVEVEGREFPCHRALLACTKYFKRMFSSDFAESKSKVVKLGGIDSTSFSKILDYVYSGEIRITEDDVQGILQAVHMLQFDRILEYCKTFIQSCLDPSNCLGVMRLADLYGFCVLKDEARDMAVAHFLTVGQNEEFLTLSALQLLDLLTDESLKVTDEDSVVHSVIRWLNHDLESRQTALSTILPEIRLSCVRVSVLKELESHPAIQQFPECLAKITAAKEEHLTGVRQLPASASAQIERVSNTYTARQGIWDNLAVFVGGWKAIKGWCEDPPPPTPMQGVICLDPDIRQWYHITNLPTPVMGCMSVTQEGRCLYMTGGRVSPLVSQGPHSAPSRQAWRYDFPTDTWVQLPDMPRGRAGHQSVIFGGKLFLVGGDVETTPNEGTSLVTMDCYDLEEGVWVKPPALPALVDTSCNIRVTGCGGKLVLIDMHMPKDMEADVFFGYTEDGTVRVHAMNLQTEEWVHSDVLVPVASANLLLLPLDDKLKLFMRFVKEDNNDVYVYDVKENTIATVEVRKTHVFFGKFLSTKRIDWYHFVEGQEGTVDAVADYLYILKVNDIGETTLPFALYGHSFIAAQKSDVGWYCRDPVKLKNENEGDTRRRRVMFSLPGNMGVFDFAKLMREDD